MFRSSTFVSSSSPGTAQGNTTTTTQSENGKFVRIVEEYDENGKLKKRTVDSDREMSTEEINAVRANMPDMNSVSKVMDESFKAIDETLKDMDNFFGRMSERMSRMFKGW